MAYSNVRVSYASREKTEDILKIYEATDKMTAELELMTDRNEMLSILQKMIDLFNNSPALRDINFDPVRRCIITTSDVHAHRLLSRLESREVIKIE